MTRVTSRVRVKRPNGCPAGFVTNEPVRSKTEIAQLVLPASATNEKRFPRKNESWRMPATGLPNWWESALHAGSQQTRPTGGARTTEPVLIEGPQAQARNWLPKPCTDFPTRSRKPFVAINCAAIPEALLEAELFGHTRGAFTGAVQGRVGRIEAADGGTLFLDEIGEMPLPLQAKLLRFVESGELQRVGDNETLKVDVRIVAATHRRLSQQTQTGAFRSDLYYRLGGFLIRTPALADHLEDLPAGAAIPRKMGREMPLKRSTRQHWPSWRVIPGRAT